MRKATACFHWPAIEGAKVIDLAHELKAGIPASPVQPQFRMMLHQRHGDEVLPSGFATASDTMVLGGHTGTHIDALCHASANGFLHGGVIARDVESHEGFADHGADQIPLMFRRGVLLDVAGALQTDILEPEYEITAADLERSASLGRIDVREGDVVLLRSGWSANWHDPVRFLGHIDGAPGPGVDAAEWLHSHGASAVGVETIACEVIHPGPGPRELPVHKLFLVDWGIHIIEVMDLSGLVSAGVYEFLFVLTPLKIRGGTGSPARPLAIVIYGE